MADDIAVLGIQVDSRPVTKADKELARLAKTSTKTAKATDGLTTSTKKATDGLGKYSTKTTVATGSTKALGIGTATTAAATDSLTRSLKAAASAAIAFVSIRAAGGLKSYADDFINIQNALKQVTDTTLELNTVTADVFDIANKTRSSISGTATLYQRLSIATDELNLSQGELGRITETINKAFIVSGATTAEAAGATRQLAQGLAAGALRGDEFNSVAEQAPLIMRAIAKETQLTIGQLREFAATGGITAKILIDSLQGIEMEVDGRFAKSIATFEQKMNLASNAMTAAAGESKSLQAAVGTAGDAVIGAAKATGFLLENMELIAGVIIARTIPATAAMIIAWQAQTSAAVAGTIAVRGFAVAMALLGGPIGAIAVAGVALAAYVSSTNEAEDANQKLSDSISRVSGELEDVFDIGKLTKRADSVRKEFLGVQTELDELERKNREVDIYGSGNLFVAKDRVIELRQQLQELQAELELVENKQQKAFDFRVSGKLEGGLELEGAGAKLREAVEAGKDFADQFERASRAQKELVSNLEKIQSIREQRSEVGRAPTVLGALTSSGQARIALQQGNVEKASELALRAAEELKAVEESTGKDVRFAATFLKSFEKIAQDAVSKSEEQQEKLTLVIEIEGESREFAFTKEGVKKAGKETSKALKLSEKKRA